MNGKRERYLRVQIVQCASPPPNIDTVKHKTLSESLRRVFTQVMLRWAFLLFTPIWAKMENGFPLSRTVVTGLPNILVHFMLNFYDSLRDKASDSITNREELPLFAALSSLLFSSLFFRKISPIKIFSNENFYGYDDGFGIRIKQRFTAIIRRHLWQESSNLRLITASSFFYLFWHCKHEKCF